MEKTKIKNLQENKEVSKEDMKKIMGGANDLDPLKELEDLGDALQDTGPEGGGSIRA